MRRAPLLVPPGGQPRALAPGRLRFGTPRSVGAGPEHQVLIIGSKSSPPLAGERCGARLGQLRSADGLVLYGYYNTPFFMTLAAK
jgi:hypothetical protein